MSPSHWIWLYCTFSGLKHTKFPSLNKKNPFSLPKNKTYSHQQQFIKRSIKTEQSWVQLIGAALCSSPSFSHGHLGKSIAHLWSKSKKRRRAGMQTRRDSKHKLFLLCRGLCFPCSDLRRAGWPWPCDRRDLRHFKHQSPAEMNQGHVEEVRECVLHVATAWNCTQSFSQSCWRGSFMQEVSFVGVTLSHGVVRWICRSQLITYLRVLFQNTQLILWKPRE